MQIVKIWRNLAKHRTTLADNWQIHSIKAMVAQQGKKQMPASGQRLASRLANTLTHITDLCGT